MLTLIEKVNKEKLNKILNIALIIVLFPIFVYLTNNFLEAIYNLGRYAGTFLRMLFNLVQTV